MHKLSCRLKDAIASQVLAPVTHSDCIKNRSLLMDLTNPLTGMVGLLSQLSQIVMMVCSIKLLLAIIVIDFEGMAA